MKGFVAINAYSTNEEYLYQAKRMQEEFALLGVQIDVIRNDKFDLYIDHDNIVSKVSDYDFCIFWDKDKYALSMIEKTGMPIFNPVDAIEKCDDKMTTYIELSGHGIPMPKTLPGLLCYTEEEKIKDFTVDIVETLGYPLVVKESYGSLGQGVYLVKDRAELLNVMEQLKCMPHLFQEYVSTSYGRDVRIIVIGGEVIGGMLRKSEGDFRSNIAAGGNGEVYPLNDELITLAKRISKLLNLDYCGIDILFGKDGPLVCEVNSNAFFFAFERVTKINVARLYAEHILRTLNK